MYGPHAEAAQPAQKRGTRCAQRSHARGACVARVQFRAVVHERVQTAGRGITPCQLGDAPRQPAMASRQGEASVLRLVQREAGRAVDAAVQRVVEAEGM